MRAYGEVTKIIMVHLLTTS